MELLERKDYKQLIELEKGYKGIKTNSSPIIDLVIVGQKAIVNFLLKSLLAIPMAITKVSRGVKLTLWLLSFNLNLQELLRSLNWEKKNVCKSLSSSTISN